MLRTRCAEAGMVSCPVNLAHRIIYGGIEFAARFGFEPHRDFDQSQWILEDIDDLEPCEEEVEFGRDGKPFYVQGPYDDPVSISAQFEDGGRTGDLEFIVGSDGSGREITQEILQPGEVSFSEEAEGIIQSARERIARVVTLGPFVFFSTATGDAWMLDPSDERAMPLARDGHKQPYPIKETSEEVSIQWPALFAIEENQFFVEDHTGQIRTFRGYPVREIQKACNAALPCEEIE
jgi:hypothetical protein